MIRVGLIDTGEALDALRDEWRALFEGIGDLPYFLTWEFNQLRWKHFSEGRELCVLIARDDDDRLIGIAPLTITTGSIGPISMRRLEFLSRADNPGVLEPSDGENLDIIAPAEHRSHVVAALLRYVENLERRWDVADLAWLSSDSTLREHVNASRMTAREHSSLCLYARLPDGWKEYERSVLGKKQAKHLRRMARLLERHYPDQVVYHRISERNDVIPAMDRLIDMTIRRWTAIGQTTPFEHPGHRAFHREFALAAFDRGWWRFYELRVGDEVIAGTCGIAMNGRHYGFQTSFELDWKQYSAGNLINATELKGALDEGLEVYDPGHGTNSVKKMWTTDERHDIRLIVSNTWKGSIHTANAKAISAAKVLAWRMLPKSTYHRLRQIVVKRMN